MKTNTKYPLQQVEILDVIMGSGKTHAILRHIENLALANRNERWIFCTEYINEVRLRTAENPQARHKWRTTVDDDIKLDALVLLLSDPANQLIAITHQLQRMVCKSRKVQDMLIAGGWKLFLDETLDTIHPYTAVKPGEIQWHLSEGRMSIDKDNYGKATWLDESARVYDKEELAIGPLLHDDCRVHIAASGKNLSVVSIDDIDGFKAYSRMIVSTYQFEGTLMSAYFGMYGLPIVPCTDVTCSRVVAKADILSNITLVTKYNNTFKGKRMSAGWYAERATGEDYQKVNNIIRKIGDNYGCKGADNSHKMGYTVPKDSLGKQREYKAIQPAGYPHTVCLVDDKGEPIPGSKDRYRSGHISCNARASNAFAHKTVMVHAFDRYPHVVLTNFLRGYDIKLDHERFAVNELLQWVWRSAVRDNKPIHLAIISERMCALFMQWATIKENEHGN